MSAPAQNRPRSAVPAETSFNTLAVLGVPAHREKRGRGFIKPRTLPATGRVAVLAHVVHLSTLEPPPGHVIAGAHRCGRESLDGGGNV